MASGEERKLGGSCEIRKVAFDSVYKVDKSKKPLGAGNFAVVRQCEDKKTGTQYAVKEFNVNSKKEKAKFKQEAAIFGRLGKDHPNIVKLYDAIQSSTWNLWPTFYLVFELISGGELFYYIQQQGKLTEKVASEFYRQLLSAVDFSHDRGIVHRDIKPENLLLAPPRTKDGQPTLKLVDYGLAVLVEGDQCGKFGISGTTLYMAPEIMRHEAYGKPVDVWSSGVTLCCLLFGYMPFGPDEEEHLAKGENLKPEYDEWGELSEGAQDLISGMLNCEPEKRMTANQVLNHPWIAQRERAAYGVQRSKSFVKLKRFNGKRKMKVVLLAAKIAVQMKRSFSQCDLLDDNCKASSNTSLEGTSTP